MYYPDKESFAALAAKGNLIPVYREIMADMDTPVSAFMKIDDGEYSFLLESIEGGEKWARYSFLGGSPVGCPPLPRPVLSRFCGAVQQRKFSKAMTRLT